MSAAVTTPASTSHCTRVALVTGAARGIGRCIAEHFAKAGYLVAVTDFDETGARDCARAIGSAATALHMDVRDSSSVAKAVGRLAAEHGAIDVLINNAGKAASGPFGGTDAQEFQALLDINVAGIYHCVQAVAPMMAMRGSGSIINMASVSAARGGGSIGNVWYGATKAAVVAMTAGLARELGSCGVRVNAISPSVIETEMVREYMTPQVRSGVLKRFPLGRLASTEDVARMALFLASDDARFVTGQNVAVDGGYLTT